MMKKVLITGGNGDIAAAIKRCLLQSGDYEIRTPGKDELDVTSIQSAEEYVDGWVPDILVNNAGYVSVQSISACDPEKLQRSIAVNLFGTFNCTAAVLKRNSSAKIINIGSSAATKVHGTWSDYCASKAGVVTATKCWAEDGVDCVCISPGRTHTKMRSGLYPNEDVNTLMDPDDFAKVVVRAINGCYPNGSHLNINKNNVKEYIQ